MQRFSITAQLDNDGNGSYAELDVCEDEDGDWVKASDALSAIVELERALVVERALIERAVKSESAFANHALAAEDLLAKMRAMAIAYPMILAAHEALIEEVKTFLDDK